MQKILAENHRSIGNDSANLPTLHPYIHSNNIGKTRKLSHTAYDRGVEDQRLRARPGLMSRSRKPSRLYNASYEAEKRLARNGIGGG